MSLKTRLLRTWPPRFLLVMVLALIARLAQHVLGFRAFDASEFLSVPVFCVMFLVVIAMVTDTTGLGLKSEQGTNVGLKGRLFLTWPLRFLLAIILILIVRLLQDVLGFRAFDASEFLSLPILGVLAVVVIALITDPSDLVPKDGDSSH